MSDRACRSAFPPPPGRRNVSPRRLPIQMRFNARLPAVPGVAMTDRPGPQAFSLVREHARRTTELTRRRQRRRTHSMKPRPGLQVRTTNVGRVPGRAGHGLASGPCLRVRNGFATGQLRDPDPGGNGPSGHMVRLSTSGSVARAPEARRLRPGTRPDGRGRA